MIYEILDKRSKLFPFGKNPKCKIEKDKYMTCVEYQIFNLAKNHFVSSSFQDEYYYTQPVNLYIKNCVHYIDLSIINSLGHTIYQIVSLAFVSEISGLRQIINTFFAEIVNRVSIKLTLTLQIIYVPATFYASKIQAPISNAEKMI